MTKPKANQMTAISYVCGDTSGRITKKDWRKIGSLPMFVAEPLAIRAALEQAI